ncbi:MAG: ATP-binding cassette domain-containing protein [Methyloprofundus sp.]|nr:ATP-binding cassette domain-containing protein [Methyloprofundus sp.]
MISIRNLTFSRGDKKIFDNISLDIMPHKITAIMGPSGTGKTTLLKLIGGQLTPDSGTIFVNQQNIHQLSRSELYELRKKMGMLFQSGALLTDMSVYDNIAFPIREHTRLTEAMIHTVVLMKLNAVGLRGARNLMPSELSGGMARRVAMARALALDPEMIMYDEPFTGQDPISLGVLVKLIKTLNHTLHVTSIVVSHDVQETTSIADYIYLMSEGKIVDQGTPDEICNTKSDWVQQFMQGKADGPVPFHYPAHDFAHELFANDTQQ